MGGWGFIFDANARLKENNEALRSRRGAKFDDHKTPYAKNRFQILQKRALSTLEKQRIEAEIKQEKKRQALRMTAVVLLSLIIVVALFWLFVMLSVP